MKGTGAKALITVALIVLGPVLSFCTASHLDHIHAIPASATWETSETAFFFLVLSLFSGFIASLSLLSSLFVSNRWGKMGVAVLVVAVNGSLFLYVTRDVFAFGSALSLFSLLYGVVSLFRVKRPIHL